MTKTFRKDTRGTVAIITSVLSLMLVSLIALSIDFMVITKVKSKMQTSLDAAVLAALNMDVGSGGGVRRGAFNASFDAHTDDLEFIDGEISHDISFERGVGSISAQANASALLDLPFSSIFNQEVRISLQTGAEFSTPDLELALVLDISSSMRGNRISELRNSTRQVVDRVLDGSSDSTLSIIPFGGSVRLPLAMNNLLASTPPNPHLVWYNGVWNQCLTIDRNDAQNGFGPTQTHEFMGHFNTFTTNPWCPIAGNEAVFATRDNAAAQALVANFSDATLSDGTAIDVGVNWGLNALSRDWRGELPGAEPGFPATPGTTTKVMVVMSDGGITRQHELTTAEINSRAGSPFLGMPRSRALYRIDNPIAGYAANSVLQTRCQAARDDGILIFAIAFQVRSVTARQSLEDCAGDPSRYFDADAGALLATFQMVLDDVASLRLTN